MSESLFSCRWLVLLALPVLFPVAVAVWLAWYVLTLPQQLVACFLALRGDQKTAAWLWNHSAMVVFDREHDLG